MKKEKCLTRELRLLGFSHRKIATLLKVSPVTVTNWVNGKHRIGHMSAIKLIELGVSREAVSSPFKEV